MNEEELWHKYGKFLLKKLRGDRTFLAGKYGKPIRLPKNFISENNTERLIISYLSNKIPFYKDVLNFQNGGALAKVNKAKKDDRVFINEDITIIVPATKEDAQQYCQHTLWCTATKHNNLFDDYVKNGPLYIIVPKKAKRPGEKYKFHSASNSYMNELDDAVNMRNFITEYPEIAKMEETPHWYRYTLKYIEDSNVEILVPKKLTRKNERYQVTRHEIIPGLVIYNEQNKKENILRFTISHPEFLDRLIYEDDDISLYTISPNNSIQILVPKHFKGTLSKSFQEDNESVYEYPNHAQQRYLLDYDNGSYRDINLNTFVLLDIFYQHPTMLEMYEEIVPGSLLTVFRPRYIKAKKIDIFVLLEEEMLDKKTFIVATYDDDYNISKSGLTAPGFLSTFPEILNLYDIVFESDRVEVYTNGLQSFVKDNHTNETFVFGKSDRINPDNVSVGKFLELYPEIAEVMLDVLKHKPSDKEL